jgi:peptidoglycan/LPS O-acetylase OafA/YrhL
MPIDTLLAPVWILALAALAAGAVHAASPFYRRLLAAEASAGRGGNRYPTLDGLRGYLALGVFIFHAYGNYLYYRFGIRDNDFQHPLFVFFGTGGVSQFFLITGFLFWGKAIAGKVDLPSHYYGRAWRIGPLFLALTLVSFLYVLWQGGLALHVKPLKLVGQIASYLTLGLLPPPKVNGVDSPALFFGPAWTLKYEWRFYLLLPFLAFFATTRRYVFLAGGFLLAAAIAFPFNFMHGIFQSRSLYLFFAGMGVAHLVRDIPAARVPFLRSGWASLLMVVAALLAAVFQDSLWAVPLHALVFIPIVYGNSLFGLLRLRASRLLGTISYSIYLLHAPLIHAVLRTLAAAGQLDNVSPLQYWLLMGGLVLVIVALCSLTYRFIEHPHLHKRLPARFQWKPRPAAVPAPAPLEHASV